MSRKYYTAKELSKLLGVHEETIRRWGRENRKENKIGTFQPYGKGGKVMYYIKVELNV